MLITEAAIAAGIVQRPALADTDARLMGFKIFFIDEMHIVGCNNRQIERLGQCNTEMQTVFIAGTACAMEFEIVGIRIERFPVFSSLTGQIVLARQ